MADLAIKVIDPHLHLFNLPQGDYHWLKPDQPPLWPDKNLIHKNYTQADLRLDAKCQLAGFVHIEAGFDNLQPWREIDWLEQHCAGPFRTVAFADITATSFAHQLVQLSQRQSVVGIRYILDDQAEEILHSKLTKQHFSLLAQAKLGFDAQLSLLDTQVTDALVAMANQFKDVSIIINHAGWPPQINAVQKRQTWRRNLTKLATCENIAIKLSGWEMADRGWQSDQVSLVIQDSIRILGENRVMLASNFPLCLFTMSYAELWNTYASLPAINQSTFEKITLVNAQKWYRLT